MLGMTPHVVGVPAMAHALAQLASKLSAMNLSPRASRLRAGRRNHSGFGGLVAFDFHAGYLAVGGFQDDVNLGHRVGSARGTWQRRWLPR
jgi:hypothetical protein